MQKFSSPSFFIGEMVGDAKGTVLQQRTMLGDQLKCLGNFHYFKEKLGFFELIRLHIMFLIKLIIFKRILQ